MPKKTQYPKPTKRFFYGAWVILWRFSPEPGKYFQYTVSTGFNREREDKQAADIVLRRFAAALAQERPEFPPEYAGTAGVQRYLADRHGMAASGNWISDYEPVIAGEVSPSWAKSSIATLKRLDVFVEGGIKHTTPDQAQKFLLQAQADDGTPAWRNRVLSMCTRFFKWAITTKRTFENPFAGFKALTENEAEEIVYCTKAERARVLAVAEGLDRPDWIAIPIALYAGCRRGEVFRLKWEDIDFEVRRLVVRKSKTGKRRVTPLARELVAILEKAKKDRGLVVPNVAGETWQNQADRLVERVRECLSRPASPNLVGLSLEAIGKRRFCMTEGALTEAIETAGKRLSELEKTLESLDRESPKARAAVYELACLQRCPGGACDGGEWIPAERIGWNAFRHTFATLRAQAGVTLDKISSWMGNTPDVCRRHYAQFQPRNVHDDEIDKD